MEVLVEEVKVAKKLSKSTISATKRVYWKIPEVIKLITYSEEELDSYQNGELDGCSRSNYFSVSINNITTKLYLELYHFVEADYSPAEHIGLSLCYDDWGNSQEETDAIDFTVKCRLGFAKKNGENFYSKTKETSREILLLYQDRLYDRIQDPDLRFSHEELRKEENGYNVGGTLTIIADVTITFPAETTRPQATNRFRSKQFSDFEKMFNNEDFCDLELETKDGKVLKAHTAILVARSPIFYDMLESRHVSASPAARIVLDFDLNVMTKILRFIYCGNVESLDEIATVLIFAADQFQLKSLKQLCAQEIVSSLKVENVVESLKIADQLSEVDELYEGCLDFIVSNYIDASIYEKIAQLPALVLKIAKKFNERFNSSFLIIDDRK